MNRRELLTALGFGQLFHGPQVPEPRCFGVIRGIEIEIECPSDGKEDCPLGHHQKPSYVVELSLSRGDEEKSLILRTCSQCGGAYVLPEVRKEPSK